ncbi:hypothetical protein BYT27DRAFT_7258425 [Phlegmacium glaucopus]|nr:hypothetical protein BYT27DRAFT_7258420 [Phlegmacium glaucopus]KAF8805313.1 hypothetical protein BYT27DRAFT_7258425 [Phlegmacium glaucopus]
MALLHKHDISIVNVENLITLPYNKENQQIRAFMSESSDFAPAISTGEVQELQDILESLVVGDRPPKSFPRREDRTTQCSTPKFPWVGIRLNTILSLTFKRYSTKINYGLTDAKSRILKFLAVGKLRGTVQGKIIYLVGLPGVGKTSTSKSIWAGGSSYSAWPTTLTFIPAPLLDRMEVLEVSAKEASGLAEADVELESSTVDIFIKYYCREIGVRNLMKHIEKVFIVKGALKLVQDLGEDVFPEPKQPGASTLAQAQTFPPT